MLFHRSLAPHFAPHLYTHTQTSIFSLSLSLTLSMFHLPELMHIYIYIHTYTSRCASVSSSVLVGSTSASEKVGEEQAEDCHYRSHLIDICTLVYSCLMSIQYWVVYIYILLYSFSTRIRHTHDNNNNNNAAVPFAARREKGVHNWYKQAVCCHSNLCCFCC